MVREAHFVDIGGGWTVLTIGVDGGLADSWEGSEMGNHQRDKMHGAK